MTAVMEGHARAIKWARERWVEMAPHVVVRANARSGGFGVR